MSQISDKLLECIIDLENACETRGKDEDRFDTTWEQNEADAQNNRWCEQAREALEKQILKELEAAQKPIQVQEPC